MYLVYIDESGKQHRTDGSRFFALSAFIINEVDWLLANNEILKYKRNRFPKKLDVELRASNLIAGKGHFSRFVENTRKSIFLEVYELISNINCKLIGCIVDKKESHDDLDIEEFTHKLLFERICKYITKENLRKRTEEKQPFEFAILLIDSQLKWDNDRTRRIYHRLFEYGTGYVDNAFLIENPVFSESKHGNLLQLADFVAFCIRSFTELSTAESSKKSWDTEIHLALQKMLPKFDRGNQGQLIGYGMKYYPTRLAEQMEPQFK